MIDVIVNEPPLRFDNRFFDGVQLLSQFDAAAAFVEHFNHAANVAIRALEALDDVRMRLVAMGVFHARKRIPPRGICQ